MSTAPHGKASDSSILVQWPQCRNNPNPACEKQADAGVHQETKKLVLEDRAGADDSVPNIQSSDLRVR